MDAPETRLNEKSGPRVATETRGSMNPQAVAVSAGVRPRPLTRIASVLACLLLLLLLSTAGWFFWVFGQIRYYSDHDGAQPADAIAVFGAAEYDGHPSPVLRARLDHALVLYKRGLAPLIITLGGQGDAYHSEGSVGRDYLMTHGVPESQIISETKSNNTEASAEQLAIIAKANRLQRIVAVSDATHLFRIRALCRHYGLEVSTSPRPNGRPITRSQRVRRMAHELLSYTLWRVGI